MIIKITKNGEQINTIIVSSQEDAAELYPDCNYEVLPDPPIPKQTVFSKIDFQKKFTQPELVAIYTEAKSDIEVEVWLDTFKIATEIDTTDEQTLAGMGMLVSKGVITQLRADEILTPV